MDLVYLHFPGLHLETTQFLCCSPTDTYILGKAVSFLELSKKNMGWSQCLPLKNGAEQRPEQAKDACKSDAVSGHLHPFYWGCFILVPPSKASLGFFHFFCRVRAGCQLCNEPVLRFHDNIYSLCWRHASLCLTDRVSKQFCFVAEFPYLKWTLNAGRAEYSSGSEE